jgi:hypothetical protein
MEKKVNKKIGSYLCEFKNNIHSKVNTLGMTQNDEMNKILQYIFDYEGLTFTKDDFAKRKRVKNFIPSLDRCCAKRANGEQCTRKRKDGYELCGTHIKGTPYGKIDNLTDDTAINTQKLDVWVQDIKGILYYIDNNNNIYQTEDILNNTVNPKVVGKYTKTGDTFEILF